jgi:hypothetical protein
MSKTQVCLIVILAVVTSSSVPVTSQPARAYGEVFAEDYRAVGYDPPSGTSAQWPNPPSMVDSGAALQSAIDAVPIDGTLRFQHCRYRTDQTLIVSRPITIQFTGSDDRVTYCGFAVAYGIVGLHLLASSTIRGVYLHANPRPGGSAPSPTSHGILMEATSHLAGVLISGFDGDGIHIDADVTRTPPTNANQWRIDGGAAIGNNGVGLFVRGGDANAGVAVRFDSVGNKGGNYMDSSFLGNTYIACHSDRSNDGPGTPDLPVESYESGWTHSSTPPHVSTPPEQIRSNKSLYLNCYEENGQAAKLGLNSMWLGGEGEAVSIEGQASVLKTDNAGFWANHFTAGFATPSLKPVTRIGPSGNVDSKGQFNDPSLAQFWVPTGGTMYVYPSTYDPGNIDLANSTSAAKESRALSLATGTARPFMEAPTGARLGRVLVEHAGSTPTAVCNFGDLAINVSSNLANPGQPWAWQCIGTAGVQGNWRPLLPPP